MELGFWVGQPLLPGSNLLGRSVQEWEWPRPYHLSRTPLGEKKNTASNDLPQNITTIEYALIQVTDSLSPLLYGPCAWKDVLPLIQCGLALNKFYSVRTLISADTYSL